jgi:hypothetical protein
MSAIMTNYEETAFNSPKINRNKGSPRAAKKPDNLYTRLGEGSHERLKPVFSKN